MRETCCVQCGANRHGVLGRHAGVERALGAEKLVHRAPNAAQPRRAANHHHFANVVGGQIELRECARNRRRGAPQQLGLADHGVERGARQRNALAGCGVDECGVEQHREGRRAALAREPLGVVALVRVEEALGALDLGAQQAQQRVVGGVVRREARTERTKHGVVEVLPAKVGVAGRGENMKHGAGLLLEHRNVERAAAEVEDEHPVHVGALVQAVRHGGERGLVDERQHAHAGERRRLLRVAPLHRREVDRHANHTLAHGPRHDARGGAIQRAEQHRRDLVRGDRAPYSAAIGVVEQRESHKSIGVVGLGGGHERERVALRGVGGQCGAVSATDEAFGIEKTVAHVALRARLAAETQRVTDGVVLDIGRQNGAASRFIKNRLSIQLEIDIGRVDKRVQIYQNDVTDTSVEDAHSAERRAQIDADRGGFGRRSMTQQHAENRRDGDERDYERGGAQIPVAHRSMTSASTKLYDAAQDANNADHIFAEHTLSVDEARTRAAVLLKDAPATTPPPPSKAPFAVSTAFTSTPTSKLAEMQRAAPPQFTNVVGSVRLADGPGDARGALQLRLEVKMIRAEHLLARTLVVPDSLSLAQLHDRVLMPAFGMPRRTPPVGFFFAPTADLMAANNGALLDTETDPATAAYMHFPLAIGNARFLTNADYALFGIKQLLIANKTALRNLDLAPGSEFAWVVAPSDAGYIFSVRVLAVLRGAARLPAPISLESGKGGAVLYLPPPPSTTLLARMAANLFPAGAAFTTVVSGLAKAGAALAVVVGGTESLMGAQLESDELVKHGLYQPFVLAFWKRHLLLHVMCTYSTDPEDEFVDAKLPLALRSTRVPYVPAPNVCQNCHAPAQLMCAGCEIVWFCTTACQHEQWALHSQFCCQLVELAAADIVPDSKVAGRVVSYAIRTQVFWVKNGSSKPEPVRIDIAKWNKQRLQQEEQQNGKNNKSGGNNNNNNNNKQKK